MFVDRLMDIMDSKKPYPFVSLATLLRGVSSVYGSAMRQRQKLYAHGVLRSYQLQCPVVSVGNLAVGGTGKTPMAIHLAKYIHNRGHRVAIISRGYKGLSQKKGAIVSDGHNLLCDVRQAGDEPYLMAKLLGSVPIVVGQDRFAAGKKTISHFNPDVILLDDAFQNLRIKRDLNLLLLDASAPFGNSFLLPRGRLREPVSALSRADAIVLTRSHPQTELCLKDAPGVERHIPMFRSVHKSVVRGVAAAHKKLPPLNELSADVPSMKDLKMFGFAGLAHNKIFFNALRQFDGVLEGTLEFDDHHAYGEKEIKEIARAAVDSGADCLVTTDKDYVRFQGAVQLPLDLMVLGVEIDFLDDAARWHQFLVESIDHLILGRKVKS